MSAYKFGFYAVYLAAPMDSETDYGRELVSALWLILLLIWLRMFTFICMLALGATAWLRAAARRRPAARTVGPYMELVGTVKISIG